MRIAPTCHWGRIGSKPITRTADFIAQFCDKSWRTTSWGLGNQNWELLLMPNPSRLRMPPYCRPTRHPSPLKSPPSLPHSPPTNNASHRHQWRAVPCRFRLRDFAGRELDCRLLRRSSTEHPDQTDEHICYQQQWWNAAKGVCHSILGCCARWHSLEPRRAGILLHNQRKRRSEYLGTAAKWRVLLQFLGQIV